jgi:protein phosphatase PTC1
MSFDVGVHEEQGQRPTMEDTHAFVVDFDSVLGQGYFGVFDGHGNKNVADWCGAEFHKVRQCTSINHWCVHLKACLIVPP